MIRGKFLAQDDFDLAGHRFLNWQWIQDIPTKGAVDGQAIVSIGGIAQWATLSSSGVVSTAWDDITGKPATFPADPHTHPWGEVTGKPTFVNSVIAGDGILVSSATGDVTIEDEYHHDTNEPNGFVNTTDSTWSFPSGRNFQIEAVSLTDGFSFYVKGQKFTKTSTDAITFSDVEGLHAFYYDVFGTLNTTVTPLDGSFFTEKALIAFCLYNQPLGAVIYQGEERHGIVMDGLTHKYLHDSEGTRYISGMALGNISADENGADISHATMQVGSGTIADEDLFLQADASANPKSDWSCYSKTDTGRWIVTSCGSTPVKESATVAQYNLLTGTTWTSTAVNNNQYLLAHIFRSTSPSDPFIAIQGEASYISKAAARAGATEELLSLYTAGLPFVEFSPLGTVIYQYSSAYGNAYKVRIVSTDTGDDYIDWREQNLQASGGGPTDHGSLSGLTDPDHPLTALQQSGASTGNAPIWNGTTWTPGGVVEIRANGLTDALASGVPSTSHLIMMQVSVGGGGSMRYATLAALPISTPVQLALNTKSATTHTHSASELTQTAATTGQFLQWTGSTWLPNSASGAPIDTIAANAPLSANTSIGNVTLTFSGSPSDVGAAALTHTHSVSDLTQTSATTGQHIAWSGATWLPATPAGGSNPTMSKMIYIETPSATTVYPMFTVSGTSTLSKVTYQTDVGNVTFNIEERGSGTPNTTGTDVLSADHSATATEVQTSTFSNTSLAAESWAYFVASAVSGTPTKVWIRAFYTED